MCVQNNKVSIWSVGDHGVSNMDGEFDEEPQLLCDSQHDGDVLDLQVRVKTHLLILGLPTYGKANKGHSWFFIGK